MPSDTPARGVDLFTASAQRVVDYLNRHTPLADWSVTRVAGGEQVHLHVHAQDLLEVGTRLDWSDSFCSRMVDGAAPVVVDTLTDPSYSDLEHAGAVRAYAGVPLTDDTGEMFGVLCGFGTEPLQSTDDVDTELVALMGGLLSTHLVAARAADRGRRDAEVAQALAQTDALTGLTNRRGWDALVADAEQRMNAYGDLVAIGVVDLDGLKEVNDRDGHDAGDRLIAAAGSALAAAGGQGDRVARYGGDEFAILANSIPVVQVADHFAMFAGALQDAGIAATIGHAVASPSITPVVEAFAQADRAMYTSKADRKVPRR